MTRRGESPKQQPAIRCAIYTRKSTEEGLQQEFNTLDAQRESGEAYIKSQAHEGWVCLREKYDDGGFTGGNMERPALKRLMADIESGGVECVVVYKVDRLSRSLIDFARMMETFEKHKVSFVAVTQQIGLGKGGTATLTVDGKTAAEGKLKCSVPLRFSADETLDIGEDTGTLVSEDYHVPFKFTGTLKRS